MHLPVRGPLELTNTRTLLPEVREAVITAVICGLVVLLNYARATDLLRRTRAGAEPELGEWAGDEILSGRPVRGAIDHAQRRLLSPSSDELTETVRRYTIALWIAFGVGSAAAFVLGERLVDPFLIEAASNQPILAVPIIAGLVIASLSLCQALRHSVGPLRRPALALAWAAGAMAAAGSVVATVAIFG